METPNLETPNSDLKKAGAWKWERGKLVPASFDETTEKAAPEETSVEIHPDLEREIDLPETIQKDLERAEDELKTAQDRLKRMSDKPIDETIGKARGLDEKMGAQAASLRMKYAEVNALKEAQSVLEQASGNVGVAIEAARKKEDDLAEKMRNKRAEIDAAKGNAALAAKLDKERDDLIELHNRQTAVREILQKR